MKEIMTRMKKSGVKARKKDTQNTELKESGIRTKTQQKKKNTNGKKRTTAKRKKTLNAKKKAIRNKIPKAMASIRRRKNMVERVNGKAKVMARRRKILLRDGNISNGSTKKMKSMDMAPNSLCPSTGPQETDSGTKIATDSLFTSTAKTFSRSSPRTTTFITKKLRLKEGMERTDLTL